MTQSAPDWDATAEGARASRDSTVARVVASIDALAHCEAEGTGVRELAARLGVSRSVVHRILANLAELRVAEALPGGRYGPGVMMLSWAALLHLDDATLRLGRAVVAELVAEVGESTILTVYGDGDVFTTIVAAEYSPHPLRYQLAIGARVPLHTGGSGKSILSRLPESMIAELPIERLSDTTIIDRAQLAKEVRQIARRGYAVSRGENSADAAGIGAAFSIDGEVAGSICIIVPTVRLKQPMVPALGARVRDAAQLLTDLLSHDAQRDGGEEAGRAEG